MSLKTILTSNVTDRAVKTFVQAAVAYYIATVGQVDTKTLYVAAAAAGLSAVWSGIIGPSVSSFLAKRKAAKAAPPAK